MSSIVLYVGLFIVLLIVSGILSGAETAFFRIQSRIRDYGEDKALTDNVLSILQKPRRLLISLLTGNTLVNVSMAFLAALLTAEIALNYNLNLSLLLIIESIVVTSIVLIFGEVMPKILAMRKTQAFARFASPPVKIIVALLYPLGSLIYAFTRLFIRLFGIKSERMFSSEEELKDLAEIGADQGTLEQSETEIIHSIFEFSETDVHEIMIPRVDIMALDSSVGLSEALEIVRQQQVSKIPIYKKSIDHIKGILYAKDILPYLEGTKPEVNLLQLARPPFFVPESKTVVSLLKEFQDRRTSIAIVVDEFGGTAGLVTLEDVVEEILGEMRDPYDIEKTEVLTLGEDEYLVEATVSLDDLATQLNCSFPEDREYDSLGGFLFDRFDQIPLAGQATVHEGRTYTVRTLQGNRIEKVHIGQIITIAEENENNA